MSYLQFEYCKTIHENYVSTGRAYAMIFDPVTGNAVQFGGAGVSNPRQLATFDPNNQENFAYLLSNPRLYCWTASVSGPTLNLPDTGYGEYYLIEYWVEVVSGFQSRGTDYLVETERFIWLNGQRVSARLDITEDQNIANLAAVANPHVPTFTGFLNISYDSEIKRIGLLAWLEQDGELVTNAKSAVITIYDSTGAVFLNKTLSALPAGNWSGQVINTVPSPDETYFGLIEITDNNNVVHSTGAGVVTWD